MQSNASNRAFGADFRIRESSEATAHPGRVVAAVVADVVAAVVVVAAAAAATSPLLKRWVEVAQRDH